MSIGRQNFYVLTAFNYRWFRFEKRRLLSSRLWKIIVMPSSFKLQPIKFSFSRRQAWPMSLSWALSYLKYLSTLRCVIGFLARFKDLRCRKETNAGIIHSNFKSLMAFSSRLRVSNVVNKGSTSPSILASMSYSGSPKHSLLVPSPSVFRADS